MTLQDLELHVTALTADLTMDYTYAKHLVLEHHARLYRDILKGRAVELIATELYLLDRKIQRVNKWYIQ